MKKYSRNQLEDKAMKSAGLYFGKELLPYFGVRKQIRRMLPTEQIRLEAVLYTFACKFLEQKDLDEVKEAFSMTVLGELIWNDGVVKGRKLALIEQVCRKLKRGLQSEQIASDLEEDYAETERICKAAQQCAPEYDSERIYQLLTTE